ncbi:MAG: glutamine-hydrolyzing carbamoyl-phosphate synthase small subunit [Acidobacteriota bacterium]
MVSVPTPSLRDRAGVLLLEDGTTFFGTAAVAGTAFGEVVFNTAMTGYQEILTDPSYRRQIVVMTQPHVGNYGTSTHAAESRRPWVEGFVARRFTARPSGTDADGGLLPYLEHWNVPALHGIDTRALVRHVRNAGAMLGVVSSEVDDLDALRAQLATVPPMTGRALVDEVTTETAWHRAPEGDATCHVALYDFGAKGSIVDQLVARGAKVTVLPAKATVDECRAHDVDGVLLSNGPGDPAPLTTIIQNVQGLLEDRELPVFGICLGHQLLGLALGARTFKLPFGHHGGNQPVRDMTTGQVRITSQNHGFAVDVDTLPEGCRATHVNLNDGTLEGFAVDDRPVSAVQYHPEAAPGPHDARDLFDRFLADSRAHAERRRAAGS